MFIDAIHRGDDIITWARDATHKLHKIVLPAPYYCYEKDENGEFRSIFGDKLSQVKFDTREQFKSFTDSRTDLFESDFSPLSKFLSEHFYGVEDTDVHIGYYDIESEVDLDLGLGYPEPGNAYGRVNSFSMYDAYRHEYHMIIIEPDGAAGAVQLRDEAEGITVVLHRVYNERQLFGVVSRIIENIDILAAWNGDGYDIPYMMERMIMEFGEHAGLQMLCRDGFRATKRKSKDSFGNERDEYSLVGRVHLDMMVLYKNFTFGERESYALDRISEDELGERKVEFEGNLGTLYRNDPQKYFEYSLHDARLLKKLDAKLKHIKQAVTMARKASVRIPEVTGTIKYLEGAIRNYCQHDRKEVLILPDVDRDARREKFPGAFVMKPLVGAHRWSSSIDLASLYPSVIRSINISPETHVLQCMGRDADFAKVVHQSTEEITVQEVRTGAILRISACEVWELMKDQSLTISANGSIFCNEQGIIPEVLTHWYRERKRLKGMAKEFALAGDQKQADYHTTLEQLEKLSLNSCYGAISNPFSRFYSLDCARSVTLTGQAIEKFQCFYGDRIVADEVQRRAA